MAKHTVLLLACFVLALGCDRRGHGTSERILGSVSVEKAFQSLNTGTVLRSRGHSLTAGLGHGTFERDELFTVAGKGPLPKDFSRKLAQALADQVVAAGGRVQPVSGTCDIWTTKTLPDPGPDTLGAKFFFSIEGSRGAMILRYTSVKADDAIGYLSCEIVEFRK